MKIVRYRRNPFYVLPCRVLDPLLSAVGPAMEQLVQPTRSTVGERLLMRQGWKPGQGIGPKVTKNTRTDRFRSYEKTYGATNRPTGPEVRGAILWLKCSSN